MSDTKVVIDFTLIDEKEFDPKRAIRVATVRAGKIVDQKTITPAKEKDPRNVAVQLSLGSVEDGVAGAEIVVAPADDDRNIFSKLTARKFVTSMGGDRAVALVVHPGISPGGAFAGSRGTIA